MSAGNDPDANLVSNVLLFAGVKPYNYICKDTVDFTSATYERRALVAEYSIDQPKASSEKRSYSVAEVAEILDVSKRSVYNLCSSGELKSVRVGTRLRISKRSFDEWLDGCESDN